MNTNLNTNTQTNSQTNSQTNTQTNTNTKTLITAHSGCENTPDNSFEFLERVLTVHADCFEFDVRKRADGVLYLSHDEPAGETPTLEDAFRVAKQCGKIANCDLKEEGLEHEVLSLARRMGVDDRIVLTGEVSRDLFKRDPEIRRIAWINLQPIFDWKILTAPKREHFETVLSICRDIGATVINPPHDFCTPEAIGFFRENGIELSVWTANTPEVAARLLEAGVKNITTRCPEMVYELSRDR